MSPRAGLDRRAVILAAAQLADQNGLEQLTLAALAHQLGIRTPSLYNYVDGLPGLVHALGLYATQELNNRLTHAAIGKSGPEAVEAIANAYRAYIMEHPGCYSATVQSVYKNEPIDPELEAVTRETLDTVLAVLAYYHFDPLQALHAVRGLRSLVHGFATLELAGGFGMPLQTDESFRYLVRLLVNGLDRLAHSTESQGPVV